MLYSDTLQVVSVTPTSGMSPCEIAADYLPAEYWAMTPFNATSSFVYGPGTSAVVPFAANSIAAFPAPDANY